MKTLSVSSLLVCFAAVSCIPVGENVDSKVDRYEAFNQHDQNYNFLYDDGITKSTDDPKKILGHASKNENNINDNFDDQESDIGGVNLENVDEEIDNDINDSFIDNYEDGENDNDGENDKDGDYASNDYDIITGKKTENPSDLEIESIEKAKLPGNVREKLKRIKSNHDESKKIIEYLLENGKSIEELDLDESEEDDVLEMVKDVQKLPWKKISSVAHMLFTKNKLFTGLKKGGGKRENLIENIIEATPWKSIEKLANMLARKEQEDSYEHDDIDEIDDFEIDEVYSDDYDDFGNLNDVDDSESHKWVDYHKDEDQWPGTGRTKKYGNMKKKNGWRNRKRYNTYDVDDWKSDEWDDDHGDKSQTWGKKFTGNRSNTGIRKKYGNQKKNYGRKNRNRKYNRKQNKRYKLSRNSNKPNLMYDLKTW